MTIDPEATVAAILDAYPACLPVLVRHGFKPLANPVTRRTMARFTTLREACERRGVELESVLRDLRQAVEAEHE